MAQPGKEGVPDDVPDDTYDNDEDNKNDDDDSQLISKSHKTMHISGKIFVRKGVIQDIQNNKRNLAEAAECSNNNMIVGVTENGDIPIFFSYSQYKMNNNKHVSLMYSFEPWGSFIDHIASVKYGKYEIDRRLSFIGYHLKIKVTDINQSNIFLKYESIYSLHSYQKITNYESEINGDWMKMAQQDYYIHYDLSIQRNIYPQQ